MKCEWEFQFETRDFRFEREHKFKVHIDSSIKLRELHLGGYEPHIRITPSDRDPPPEALQVGSLFVELPYNQAETRDFAVFLAKTVVERIRFTQGDFRINWGLLICKHIPETNEEEAQLEDKIYGIELNFVEVSATAPSFNPGLLEKSPSSPSQAPLIAQFNEAEHDHNPITQFLGFYRIIESVTHSNSESAKNSLKNSKCFNRAYEKIIIKPNLDADVTALVSTRHKCAHLKLSNGFGYTPIDPAVQKEVKPLVELARALAHELILSQASGVA